MTIILTHFFACAYTNAKVWKLSYIIDIIIACIVLQLTYLRWPSRALRECAQCGTCFRKTREHHFEEFVFRIWNRSVEHPPTSSINPLPPLSNRLIGSTSRHLDISISRYRDIVIWEQRETISLSTSCFLLFSGSIRCAPRSTWLHFHLYCPCTRAWSVFGLVKACVKVISGESTYEISYHSRV